MSSIPDSPSSNENRPVNQNERQKGLTRNLGKRFYNVNKKIESSLAAFKQTKGEEVVKGSKEMHALKSSSSRKIHTPFESINLSALAAKKEDLSKEEKLKVIAHIKKDVEGKKLLYGEKGYNELVLVLDAAEKVLSDQSKWNKFVTRMNSTGKDRAGIEEIRHMISSQLGLASHPEDNYLGDIIQTFGDRVVRGYLIAQEKGIPDDFINSGLRSSNPCFEARSEVVDNWLEFYTIEDSATALNFDSKRHDRLQIISSAYLAFQEQQLREYYKKNFKFKHDRLGVKIPFTSNNWKLFRENLKDQRFYNTFNTKERFVAFLKSELKLPMHLETKVDSKDREVEITEGNVGRLVDNWIDFTMINPFEKPEEQEQAA